jgi:hypothetical protein
MRKAVVVSLLVILVGCSIQSTNSLGLAPTDAALGGSFASGGATGMGGTSAGSGGGMALGGAAGTGGYYVGSTGPADATGGATGAGGDRRSDAGSTLAELCTTTGGTVSSVLCCQLVSDFPSTCAPGACSCAATNSTATQKCDCGANACFDRSLGCRPADAGP